MPLYMTASGLGFRAEAINYDEDVRLAQLAVLYRFGDTARQRQSVMTRTAAAAETPTRAAEAATTETPTPSEEPATAAALPTESQPAIESCDAELPGMPRRVNYGYASAEPVQSLSERFGPVTERLNDCPDAQVLVSGHSDD